MMGYGSDTNPFANPFDAGFWHRVGYVQQREGLTFREAEKKVFHEWAEEQVRKARFRARVDTLKAKMKAAKGQKGRV